MALSTEDSQATPKTGVPPAPRLVHRRMFLGSRKRQIGAAAVILAAIGFLLYQGLGNATQYYKTVPQAVSDRHGLGTRQFRIMGNVNNDVRQVNHKTDFDITWQGVTVPVIDTSDPSTLFKPGIPVVLEGHFAPGSAVLFDSDLIMVKHSANYVPAKGEPKSVVEQSSSQSSTPAAGQPSTQYSTSP